MPPSARVALAAGLLVLTLAISNGLEAGFVSPALQRAEILAGLSGVGLMLVAVLWTQAAPVAPKRVELEGPRGLRINDTLPSSVRYELAWGSHLLLTATPAATVLLYWNGVTLLHRGILTNDSFLPGAICMQARERGKLISLVDTRLFPGRTEFDSVTQNLPAVMVYPLSNRGWLVLGGWSSRCFSRSDERWLCGWAEKIRTQLEMLDA
ncbi:cofactor assembly of complex C subunit B [cyanobiont of Ornithocercus magnificus]|nr:cofactor assembly of complex C subunit B [cyanobiont of Ornithocercus magnificus]